MLSPGVGSFAHPRYKRQLMSESGATSTGKRRRLPPTWALLLLAPVLGELVSCHQSPIELFNPLVFVLMALPYGCGALLCRELTVRWNKGLPALLLLGLAYGLFEEGVVVRSLFNPDWQELGEMGRHGFMGGVHWVYGTMLLHFHVYVSIVASVLLAETLYPQRRRQPWLNRTGLALRTIGLLLWWPAGWAMTRYCPPAVFLVLPWVAIALLVLAARLTPALGAAPPRGATPRPAWFFLVGLLSLSTVFVLVGVGAKARVPSAAVMLVILAAVEIATLCFLLRGTSSGAAWEDAHRFAWVAGTLAFFLFFGFAQDLEGFQGRSLVALVTIGALWRHGRRINARSSAPLAASV